MAMGAQKKRPGNYAPGHSVTAARDAVNRTWFGMTILQSRLLAVQIGTLLVAIGGIYTWYDNYFAPFYERHPILSWTLPAILVAYILCFSVGPQAWGRYCQARRDALALTSNPEAAGPRHFRLDPYVTATPEEFHREDDAHNDVLRWIRENTRPVLFLSGVSGSGKSSVLEAYVLPLMQADGWRIGRVRSFGDPLPQLEAALVPRRPRGTRLLIVFDQFEEFVILEDRTSAEERRRFLARVRELRHNPPPGVFLLFAFRRDYMSDIIGMKIGDLIPGQSYMEIDAFKRDAARRFLEKGPNTPAPTLVDRLLTGAEALDDVPARFRPVTLNMLGLALQDFDRQVTGRPERLVQGFMEAAITQPEIRETAPKVVEKMITDANTKRPRTVVDLVADTGLRDRDVAASLLLLERRGLVRRLDAVTELWEISHDFVARQFAMLLGRLRPSPWPRIAMFASPILFALALGSAVFGIPIYLEKQASDALGELGVSVAKESHLQVARLSAETDNATLRNALPYLMVKGVQVLDLSGSQVSTLPSLQGLTALQALKLRSLKIENFGSLKDLTTLRSLDLGGAEIKNLEPLKGLTALEALDVSFTKVENLEPLKGLSTLQWLSLVGTTKVENLEPLTGLTALQLLHLGRTNVENLEPLKSLTALKWLDVSGTRVRNLEPLKGLTALQHLDLGATRVESLEPLEDLTALQDLYPAGVPEAELARFKHYRQEKNLPLVGIH